MDKSPQLQAKGLDTVIYLTTDNNYVATTKVAIHSLLKNGNIPQDCPIVLFVDNDVNVDDLKSLSDRVTIRKLNFNYEAQEATLKFLPDNFTYGASMTCKATDILHREGVRRAVWLDSDIMVLNDLSKLLTVDLDGYTLGAALDHHFDVLTVLDRDSTGVSKWSKPNNRLYFNSGVLVYDLQEFYKAVGWDVGGYEKTLNEKSGTLDFMDQSILNEAIQGQVHVLHQKYNWTIDWLVGVHDDRSEKNRWLSEFPASLVHFVGPDKPWDADLPPYPLRTQYRLDVYLKLIEEIESSLPDTFVSNVRKHL